MTVFLYTATDASGKASPGRIDAASLEAARFRLEQQGWRDVVFHTDESMAISAKAHSLSPSQSQVSAARELQARQNAPRGLAFLARVYAGNWIVWVVPLAWALWQGAKGPPYSLRAWISFAFAIAGLIIPLWAAIPARAYNALLEASAWARWDEVRARCAAFRRWGRFFLACPPALELDMREASAIAAQGDLTGALARVQHYEAMVQPRVVYLGRIASLYTSAKDWPGMARCQEEAWRLSDGAVAQAIDYATTLVWRLRDADGAEQVLASVADRDRAELAQSFTDYAQGLIALERDQWQQADDLLLKALAVQASIDNPLMRGLADFIQAYRAIAVAKLGDKAQARALLRAALPRLTAHKDLELARRCAAAVA